VQGIRAREIDLYSRIVDAKNRKQAIERGAGEVLTELEHELAKKGAAREDESSEWAHLRQLAQIRMRTEIEIAQQGALEARQLAQQRFSHQLLQQQIQNKMAQALAIEDQERKRAELGQLQQGMLAAKAHERRLVEEQNKAALQSLALANVAYQREAERVQEWEDQLALDRKRELLRADQLKDVGNREQVEQVSQKIDALKRGGAEADAIAQHEKLLRTIAADGQHTRQAQELQLDAEQRRHALRLQEQEAAWQQELRCLEHAREEKFAQLAHEISRIESIGGLSDTAKIALAATPNAQALADYMKTQVHATMGADQLTALSGVVSATNSMTPAEAARMAYERAHQERMQRDAEVDKDRRHQLDLLNLQNDVNKAALSTQSQLGVGVAQARAAQPAQRVCANGHAVGPNDKFCAQCGVALQP